MTLVRNLTASSTIAVRGLDNQLFIQFNKLAPGVLVSIADLDINHGEGLFPYLQAPAKNALRDALKAHGSPLTVNSAYRSIVAQAVLYSQKQRGLIANLVAYPGKSDHQNAASVDIEEWSNVIHLMTNHGWEWTYGNADAMHFDCRDGDIRAIKEISIKAFQSLWNLANPSHQIPVDGDLGEGTLECIYNSPAEGFHIEGYHRVLKLTDPIQEGDDVGKLQLALKSKGFFSGADDGIFGKGTEDAVKAFQKSIKTTEDGIVGEGTRSKLGLK